ncbi:7690_t:CDS:2 [Paraglomus brasilianum]|uniref:7690_t:CDS:1 n=1 Tax=Paraglomus brasilianum TaxID=144538 RepID=A0A9N8WHN2_9GLOM|nr:7690_t:CDS:2 [Paraglomus brasilianum]
MDNGDAQGANHNDPVFRAVGISLALASGLFIGSSFIFKKKGLLQETNSGAVAGQGHSYLSNKLWWLGMILMIIGELCNFVAYAFAQAIIVTPLGALSVVISAVLSSVFLKERLNLQGKIGCALCILGAVMIVIHSPDQQSASTIDEFSKLFFAPVFLVYTCLAIITSIIIIWKVAPKYGSKNMLVYIGICSLIGSLSVVTTQGLGTAIVTSIMGNNQLTHWFFYVLLVFVVATLLTEINYLNKALNLFNTAMVTPVYYVTFTSLTIISSAILFQGFTAPLTSIISVILGFLVICCGILCLQTSKAPVEDVESVFSPDDKRLSLVSDGSYEPGASEIRASFGSLRRYSMSFNRPPNGNGHPQNGNHRRSVSLNLNARRGSNGSSALPVISEHPATIAVPNRGAGNKYDSRAAVTQGENIFGQDVELGEANRSSTVRFNVTPIIHTSAPSIDTESSLESPTSGAKLELPNLPPPLSPLQHPIDYLKTQVSSGTTAFTEILDESARRRDADKHGSTSSRRSQNKLSVLDRFKFGMDKDNEDAEELMRRDVEAESSTKSGKKKQKGTYDYDDDDDANTSGTLSPM